MTSSPSAKSHADERRNESRWLERTALLAACGLVIVIYAIVARAGAALPTSLDPATSYYNLLVRGFRAGQLNLKTDIPPGLSRLANPYDPVAHSHFPVQDLSYYKGKLYLYFGVAPVFLLFWPYAIFTGRFLSQQNATLIFCVLGFLTGAGLLWAVWQRYFPRIPAIVLACGIVALGLAGGAPFLLARSDVYEVTISCGFALIMLALLAIWKTFQDREREVRWLAAASVCCGLAIGARPSLLVSATVLLVPLWHAWHIRRKSPALALAAFGPIMLVGIGLLIYNWMRFDNPFEFGFRYQLTSNPHWPGQTFSPRFFWVNFRIYFFSWTRWVNRFPFVQNIITPALPAGHGVVEEAFGILSNVPIVWLTLAVPTMLRGKPAQTRASFRVWLAAVAVLFVTSALTLCLYYFTAGRYEVEFLMPLMVLSVIGAWSLEDALWDRPLRRWIVRWVCGVLLGVSVAFNLLFAIQRCAEAHHNLAAMLERDGKFAPAVEEYNRALRVNPNFVEAHYRLGGALARLGKMREAISQWDQALQIDPDYIGARIDLGNAFLNSGNLDEAIAQYQEALRVKPDYAEAHNNLGVALMRLGKNPEAMLQFEQALETNPDFPEAHYCLGSTFEKMGKTEEAIKQYELALRANPNLVVAQKGLSRLRSVQ